ncbi:hypothetical protein [Capnocytophaga sputigena]|jgi:hypothetical protein|uniref:hypothetical protein n=1 Tax=Capnocytophaga sputigena TaxID=1019 RepID=UPI0028D76A0F|nr:hypothetical protein [Capnocytophaga sputigena]
MKYANMREEEVKNKVAVDWFLGFDTTQIIGNIDFSVFPEKDNIFHSIPLLWAEAKKGDYDVVTMFVQLILTIGKARTYTRMLPPAFLGAFDAQKIAFVPYNSVESIFSINDFNWNVTPSDHESKEFAIIKERIEADLQRNSYLFDFEKDAQELRFFISHNLANATDKAKQTINKSNFVSIYLRWLEVIKPIIDTDWEALKKNNILDCDFYLADLFVDDKGTPEIDDDIAIYDNLFVLFENQGYKIPKKNLSNTLFDATISIKDKTTYQNFWKLYKRPPHSDYHDYIIERRELLVPQDIRERKGAFFTPRQWVALSQQYLADYLGENWQEEYYVWDCAAGTGNLLAGLTNKYNIFASTLDQADVNVMHERIQHGALLIDEHVFQFDFLNDEFIPKKQGGKLPDALFDIISDNEKRKKLVVYINPPYAEAGNTRQRTGTGENKAGTAIENRTYQKYKGIIGKASNELFAQFLIRIYKEIPNCKIAEFSKLKILQSSNFSDFRKEYRAKLEKIFIIPANTFDNVKGQFPIGFKIWDSSKKEEFTKIVSPAYIYERGQVKLDSNETFILPLSYIGKWIKKGDEKKSIGMMNTGRNDFQNQNLVHIQNETNDKGHSIYIDINNLIQSSLFFAVRWVINATWKNDRKQFEIPDDGWETDKLFQNDCLTFTLFHGQNRISSKEGINHWIPFTEQEVNAPTLFSSHFMTDFIKGKIKPTPPPQTINLFTSVYMVSEPEAEYQVPLHFSEKAKAVFEAGRQLWMYYFTQPNADANASLYDIREYFQGRNANGKMNNKSEDKTYNQLIGNLRETLNRLAKQIEPKVYEYRFLL